MSVTKTLLQVKTFPTLFGRFETSKEKIYKSLILCSRGFVLGVFFIKVK